MSIYRQSWADFIGVALGGGGGGGGEGYCPHSPEEYAKYPVLSTFEADFCPKNKNSSPIGIGDENRSRT